MNESSVTFLFSEDSSLVSVTVGYLFLFYLFFIPYTYVLYYAKSKIQSDYQAKIGFQLTGPNGLFQGFADLIKLFEKSLQNVSDAIRPLGGLKSVMILAAVMLVPISSTAVVFSSQFGPVAFCIVLLALVFFDVIESISTDSELDWIIGYRKAGRAFLALPPILFLLLSLNMELGTLSWLTIVETQRFSPVGWRIFSAFPFNIIFCVTFLFSGMLLVGLRPFDTKTHLAKLRQGEGANQFGLSYGLGSFTSFLLKFLWFSVVVIIFFGGWKLPLFLRTDEMPQKLVFFLELSVLVTKVTLLVFLNHMLNRALPALNFKQIRTVALVYLIPLSLVAFLGNFLWTRMF